MTDVTHISDIAPVYLVTCTFVFQTVTCVLLNCYFYHFFFSKWSTTVTECSVTCSDVQNEIVNSTGCKSGSLSQYRQSG